jgi:hypothetical protein
MWRAEASFPAAKIRRHRRGVRAFSGAFAEIIDFFRVRFAKSEGTIAPQVNSE